MSDDYANSHMLAGPTTTDRVCIADILGWTWRLEENPCFLIIVFATLSKSRYHFDLVNASLEVFQERKKLISKKGNTVVRCLVWPSHSQVVDFESRCYVIPGGG